MTNLEKLAKPSTGDCGIDRFYVSRSQIVRSHREGDDLVLELANGEEHRIVNHFLEDCTTKSAVLLDSPGQTCQLELAEVTPRGEIVETMRISLWQMEEMFSRQQSNAFAGNAASQEVSLFDHDAMYETLTFGIPLGLLAFGIASGEGGNGDRSDYRRIVGKENEEDVVGISPTGSDGNVSEYEIGDIFHAPASVFLVDLASQVGPTLLVVSSAELVKLSERTTNYLLSIDGSTEDTVRFKGDFYDTGRFVGSRQEYRSSDGVALVQIGVSVEGTQDPLDALRENIAEATVEMFEIAGVVGVTSSNLMEIGTVIGAFGDGVAAMAVVQLQSLVEIVTDGRAVSFDGSIERAVLESDKLILDVNTDSDAAIEQRVTIDIDTATAKPNSLIRAIDIDSDGKFDEVVETDGDFDGSPELVVVHTDGDNDGTIERVLVEVYEYGIRTTTSIARDHDDNGTGDGVWKWYYDSTGENVVYIVKDGTRYDDTPDGTFDFVEYPDFVSVEVEIDGSWPELVGLKNILLSGRGGKTTLAITDRGLSQLANGQEDYVLQVWGDTDDRVLLSDEFYATGQVHRHASQYQSRSGTVVVHTTPVSGGQQPLDVLREHWEEANVELFLLVGIRGVSVENLPAVRELIDAHYDGVGTLSLQQLQVLARIAIDGYAVPENGTIESVDFAPNGLALVVIARSSPAVEQRIMVNLDETASYPISIIRTFDVNEDGSLGVRREFDSNYDGAIDHTVTRMDADSDERHEDIITNTFVNGVLSTRLHERDNNDDGTIDQTETWSYHSNGTVERHIMDDDNDGTDDRITFYNSLFQAERVEFDSDDNGTMEVSTWIYHANGSVERMYYDGNSNGNFEVRRVDVDVDGSWDWVGYDIDDDGGIDRLELLDVDVFAVGISSDQLTEFAGVGTIDLASSVGSTELALSGIDLDTLANGLARYTLVVNGDDNDILTFLEGAIYHTDDISIFPEGNEYRGYRSGHRIIAVDTDVTVLGALAAPSELSQLASHLQNLETATVEDFEQTGIKGLTASNLENFKKIMEARRAWAWENITVEEAQMYAHLASDGIALQTLDVLISAFFDHSRNLNLHVRTDGDEENEEEISVTIDYSAVVPERLTRIISESDDSTWSVRTEEDADYNGTIDRAVLRYDLNDDGTYEKEETEEYATGALQTKTTLTDENEDGTFDLRTVVHYDVRGAKQSLEQYVKMRRLRLESDVDGDGTSETAIWSYHENGNVNRKRTDRNSDGTFEKTSVDSDADGSWDWFAFDTDDNGRPERVEIVNGDVFAAGMPSELLTELAGIGTIDLAGGEGSTVLSLSDTDLQSLADSAENYYLTINGGANDVLTLTGSMIYSTDIVSTGADGIEYREYRGMSETVAVDTDIEVNGAQEKVIEFNSLPDLLENWAISTIEMFEQFGVTGLDDSNFERFKMIIGAKERNDNNHSFAWSLDIMSLGEVQAYATVASDGTAIGYDDDLKQVTVGDGGFLHMRISTDDDEDIEEEVYMYPTGYDFSEWDLERTELGGVGVPWKRRTVTDIDYDGTIDFTEWQYDDQNDGTFERDVVERYVNEQIVRRTVSTDENEDAKFENRVVDVFSNGTLETRTTFSDENFDGNYDLRTVLHFNDAAQEIRREIFENSRRTYLEHDSDGDGTKEITTWSYLQLGLSIIMRFDMDSDGNFERVFADISGDGSWDWLEHDVDDDGKINRLEIIDDNVFAFGLWPGHVVELVGVDTIDLNGRGGSVELTISDDDLTVLSAGMADYVLTVNGGSGDVLVLRRAEFYTIGAKYTDIEGMEYNRYHGSMGTILVRNGVDVTGATMILENRVSLWTVLATPESATVESFREAGIDGVTNNTVGSLIKILQAQKSIKALGDISLEEVQMFAGIVGDGIAMSPTDDVVRASFSYENLLNLNISTDGDGIAEHSVSIYLNWQSHRPAKLTRFINLDNDPNWDTYRESDRNYDGTLDDARWTLDSSNDGTNDRVMTEQYVDGTFDERKISTLSIAGTDGDNRTKIDNWYNSFEQLFLREEYFNNVLARTETWSYHSNGEIYEYVEGSGDDRVVELRRQYNEHGRVLRVEQYDEGDLSELQVWGYRDDQSLEYFEQDNNQDGNPESRTDYNYRGLKERTTIDENSDGTANRIETWDYHGNGKVSRHEVDQDADGTVDVVMEYDVSGALIQSSTVIVDPNILLDI